MIEDPLSGDLELPLLGQPPQEERFQDALDPAAVHRGGDLGQAREPGHLLHLIAPSAADEITVHPAQADGVYFAVILRDELTGLLDVPIRADAFEVEGDARERIVRGLIALR